MNMTEYAKEMGTSKTTLYRKVAEAGIALDDVRGADGQLTPEGCSILAGILDGTAQRRKPSRTVDGPEGDATQAGKVEELERQLSETRAALDAANARITELQQQALDRERENAEAWQRFSERQQQLEAQRLLTAQAGPRRGFLGRLHDRLFGEQKGGNDDT